MKAQDSLGKIRTAWLQRVAHSVARGVDVRKNFEKELEKFYSLLEQVVATGDPAWLDSILVEWAASPTQSDLEGGEYNLSLLFTKMIEGTVELAREMLTKSEALDLLTALIPVYTHGMGQAARLEMEARVTFVSKRLENVQQHLELLDSNKSNFVSVAAHELKTPLTLVEGYTSIMSDMLDATEQPQLDDIVKGMNKGVNRLHEIINDMIDISVLDNNLLSLHFQQTTILHIINLVIVELEESIENRKQTLHFNKFTGIDTWLYADPERIHQALRNILVNAIKYTPDSGEIKIDGRALPGFIELTVTDNGIGIAPEHQAAIFEKFAQFGRVELHSSGKTKYKGGGPGLGLPISRGIIEAHGGTIWVESEGYDEEKCPGSTFHILIPIRTEATDPKAEKLFPQEMNIEEAHGQKNT